MARQPEKKVKLGRNDRCWCGSGKKYKDCHLQIEQAYRVEQFRLRQAQDPLFAKIIEAAQHKPETIPAAFELFWQGKYSLEQMQELDTIEDRGAERFLTWFAFDYTLDDEPTLVQQLAQAPHTDDFVIDEVEARLLPTWTKTHLRPYSVMEIRKGQGVTLRDLLDDTLYELNDDQASRRTNIGEVLVGHLVPVDIQHDAAKPNYYLAGAAAQLTGDTADKLVEFAGLYLEDLRRTQPDADWSDLIRQRSFILNHFVMALPHEVPDPTIFDKIITETRIALQLTGESLVELVRRDKSDKDESAETRSE